MPFLTILAGEAPPAARRPESNWRPAAKRPRPTLTEMWGNLFRPKGATRAPATSPLQRPKQGVRRPSNLGTLSGSAVERYLLGR